MDGQTISKGQALITYSTKDEATLALKKLPFEDSLGTNVEPDLFVTKEARMRELDKNNPFK
jgi:hypothetical protein